MSKILFIGEYFPKFSKTSVKNHILSSSLTTCGHQVTLLSDSWCRVKESDFWDGIEFGQKPFSQMYFVDPLQLRYIGERKDDLVRNMVGLAYQIIETETFDYIYVSGIEYITVGQLIKSSLNVPILLGIYNENLLMLLNETYTKSLLSVSLNQFDRIFSNKLIREKLLSFNKKLPCEERLPFSSINFCKEVTNKKDINEIYLVGNKMFDKAGFYNLPDELRSLTINTIVYGEGKELLLSKFSKFNLCSRDLSTIPDLKTVIPKGARIIDPNDFAIEHLPDLDKLMLWLRCGFKPIINKLSKQYLSFYYNVEISKLN